MNQEINVNVLAHVLAKHFKMDAVMIDKAWVAQAGGSARKVSIGAGGQLTIEFSGTKPESELEKRVRALVDYCYPDGKWRGTVNMKKLPEHVFPLYELMNGEIK